MERDTTVAGRLRAAVLGRKNIVVSGGTGAGKSTLLNALTGLIPESERLIFIEDVAELQPQQPHVVRLETRPANVEGKGEVRIRDLVRNALRMRPDRIIVGECRGGEAFDMLQAMSTGHPGSMTTVHANTPEDALLRLESMVLMAGTEMPVRAIRQLVGSAVDLIVQIARVVQAGPDGKAIVRRRVTHLTQVDGFDGESGDIKTTRLFTSDGVVV